MYRNIPLSELTKIIKHILDNNSQISEKCKQGTVILLNTILNQNYLQFQKKYYRQNDGIAMGASTSAILAEIFV
jgi:hypothetical protein